MRTFRQISTIQRVAKSQMINIFAGNHIPLNHSPNQMVAIPVLGGRAGNKNLLGVGKEFARNTLRIVISGEGDAYRSLLRI